MAEMGRRTFLARSIVASGAVSAAVLVGGLLMRWLYLIRSLGRDETNNPFVRCSVTWMIQVLIYGMLTPLLSMHLMIPAAVLMYLYLAAEWKYRPLPKARTRLVPVPPARQAVRSLPGSAA